MRSRSATNTIIWIVGAVFLIGLVVWALVRILNYSPRSENGDQFSAVDISSQTASMTLATSPGSRTPSETYTNQTYGFSISYPADLRTGPFTPFHALRNNWRVNASPDMRGTPIVAIVVARMENGTTTEKSYPLFFGAEVRVGVSNDMERCYDPDDGYTLETVADVSINGATWKKFIFGNAAATQYLSGASYRTIRNGKCYALEQIRTGSTYRDDSMAVAYSDGELDALYAKTSPIILSFRFTE